MTVKKRRALWIVGICLVLGAPGTAQAVSRETSYQGSDWSNNSSAGTTLYVYDGENDGRDVAGDYQRAGSSSTYSIVNGSGSGRTVSGNTGTVIYRHRAVELVPYTTDAYGPWVYPR